MHWSEHLRDVSLKIPATDNSQVKRHFISCEKGKLIICPTIEKYKDKPVLLSFGRAEIEGGIADNGWRTLGAKVRRLQGEGLLE